MEFRILGALEVRIAGRPVPLGEPQQQIVLAVLLLEPGRVVGVHRLVDAVWDQHPPVTAQKQIRNRVGILRRLLSQAGHGHAAIVTERAGYRLAVDTACIDRFVFDERVRLARVQRDAGRIGDAAAGLRCALALWRGPLLDGLNSPVLREAATTWEQRRQAVVDECLTLELALGRHGELLDELTDLVAAHPMSEGLRAKLMVALYRSGRRAEALAVYHDLRQRLDTELGVAPVPALQHLYVQILRSDPALNEPASGLTPAEGVRAEGVRAEGVRADHQPGRVPAPPAREAPTQLPADLPSFAGRADHLHRLDTLLADAGNPTSVIAVLTGTAGVGKTALAVHWAHQVADQFPDGQLYVNLRGFDPDGRALSQADAVRGFLDALGVPHDQIPPTLDAQIGRYRSLLTGRRVLIVLDNARNPDQIRPLLPGSPGCLVLVTSRNQLTPLVAVDGAHPIGIDLMPPAEARELLARRLGTDRLAAEPRAADSIVVSCAGLPLALSIVAARAQQTGFPLHTIATELTETGRCLDALDAGDATSQVRAVLSWSYEALQPRAQRLFRLLGLHPGPDNSTPAAASLAGQPVPSIRTLLAELARANLLTEHSPGRYFCHDLLRAYAAELAHEHEPTAQRRAAVSRLLDHYLHTAYAADRLLAPHRDPIYPPLRPPSADTCVEPFNNHHQAMSWLAKERRPLLAALHLAHDAGYALHTLHLAWAIETFLDRRGDWHELAAVWQMANQAAEELADPAAQALACRLLARAHTRLAQHAQAHVSFWRAFRLYQRAGDRAGQAHVHNDLAIVQRRRGQPARALQHAQRAHDLFGDTGHQRGQAIALNTIGWNHAIMGEYAEALRHCERALTLLRNLGDSGAQAATLDSLGFIHRQVGNNAEAVECYRQTVTLFRQLGDRYREADGLVSLGDMQAAAGDQARARAAWHQALVILTSLGHDDAELVRAKLRSPIDGKDDAPGARHVTSRESTWS